MKRTHAQTTPILRIKPQTKKGDYQKGRELNKQPKMELKAFDIAANTQNFKIIAGATFQVLNAMVNGAEMYNRVGRKIYMKSLHIRGQVVSIAATPTTNFGRIIVFYDSQSNIANPTMAGLLQDSNVGAATSAYSEINLTNRQRFKILRDVQFILPLGGGAATPTVIADTCKQSLNVDMFIPLKGLEAIYNGTNGGTIADITSGSIIITCTTDANTDTNAFTFTSRLRYYD